MATGAIEFKIKADFTALAAGLAEMSRAVSRTAKAFDAWNKAQEAAWVTMPGEWPDNFVLLNRYVRTGVRPRFLING